jgi:hypothetical protein
MRNRKFADSPIKEDQLLPTAVAASEPEAVIVAKHPRGCQPRRPVQPLRVNPVPHSARRVQIITSTLWKKAYCRVLSSALVCLDGRWRNTPH